MAMKETSRNRLFATSDFHDFVSSSYIPQLKLISDQVPCLQRPKGVNIDLC